MADLTPAQYAVVLAILAARHAAPELAPIVESCGEEPVAALVVAGLIVRWQAQDGERVTFTPLATGPDGFDLDLAERVEFAQEERTINGADEHRSVPSEEPYWVAAGTEWGPVCRELGCRGVVQPPEGGRWVRLERPELVEDHRQAEPEWLVDEDGEPVKILGQQVPIDRKIKRPRRRGPKRAG